MLMMLGQDVIAAGCTRGLEHRNHTGIPSFAAMETNLKLRLLSSLKKRPKDNSEVFN